MGHPDSDQCGKDFRKALDDEAGFPVEDATAVGGRVNMHDSQVALKNWKSC